MKKHEIKVGGLYLAKVNGVVVTVRVDAIREAGGSSSTRRTVYYDVTSMKTGKRTTFHSAAKFRGTAEQPKPKVKMVDHDYEQEAMRQEWEDEQGSDPSPVSPVVATEELALAGELVTPADIAELAADVRQEEAWAKHGEPPLTAIGRQLARLEQPVLTGRMVAGMMPNPEQEAILEIAEQPGLQVLVVAAGAGTGKTATLKMLEQVLPGRGQYTAFNAPLVAESKAKFVRAACNTTHSLAFREVGKRYAHRLPGKGKGSRMRSSQVAQFLGLEPITVQVVGQVDETGTAKTKTLSAEFLAGQVLVAIRTFCQSADCKLSAKHFRYIDGIDSHESTEGGSKRRTYANNDRVKEALLPFADRAWADLCNLDGQLPFSHDCYVKIWQLGSGKDRPVIAADYILLDEAQDTAPVFLDILKQQRALLVFVGDENQQIYAWRGAVDAMKAYPDAPRRLLSQSYRFGQAIADVANTILAQLDEPTDLVMRGMESIPSRVAEVAQPRCYLYRTNAAALGRTMKSVAEGRRPFLLGNVKEAVEFCRAALDLQAKRSTSHFELGCFSTWTEVEEYSKTDEGEELRLMVKLVTEFGAQPILDALKDLPAREQDADLVISTAHKSKGREWDTVKLGQDFPTANRMNDADRRLLYVAATRAKLTLDVSACPPFCGGIDTKWGEGGEEATFIPGLKIAWTRPMPTQAEQDAWLAEREAAPSPSAAVSESQAAPRTSQEREVGEMPTQPSLAQPNGSQFNRPAEQFTWTSHDGNWCVRGPVEKVGQTVEVERRDGSKSKRTLKTAVRKFSEAWIYSV